MATDVFSRQPLRPRPATTHQSPCEYPIAGRHCPLVKMETADSEESAAPSAAPPPRRAALRAAIPKNHATMDSVNPYLNPQERRGTKSPIGSIQASDAIAISSA